MSLDARVVCSRGALAVDVALTADAGEVIAILGPTGAGKSTILRCLAGLLPLEDGHVQLDDVDLDRPSADVFIRPEHRSIGFVFQNYLLFPSMTALENVAFGLRARGMPARQARSQAATWIERVGLTDHAAHLPSALSGGQAQRIALARAMATEPRLLLLDEPLAALDAGTRSEVRRELQHELRVFHGVRILVTHDPLDAYALADRVVVLQDGKVVQQGTLTDVTARPKSRYVADLVGVNLVKGTAAFGVLTTPSGAIVQTSHDVHGAAFALIEPRSIALYRSPPDGSPRNVWATTVTAIDPRSHRVRLDGPIPLIAEVTLAALDALALQPGDQLWASVKASEITIYPA
jgi:molybdate transport system ATP-binding protein